MRITRLIIFVLIGIISTNVYSTYSVDQKTTSVDINGVSIAYTTSGNKEDPTVLMIMGLMASRSTSPSRSRGVTVAAIKPFNGCLLYTSPSPRDYAASRMPSSA